MKADPPWLALSGPEPGSRATTSQRPSPSAPRDERGAERREPLAQAAQAGAVGGVAKPGAVVVDPQLARRRRRSPRRLALECRSTFVTLSRTTQPAASCHARGIASTLGPDLDAGRAQQRAGAVELVEEVGGPVAAGQLARLAQRLVGDAAHLEHPLGGALVAAGGQGGGQLGLDGDRREPPAEHVVHVAREAQPLLDHRQLRPWRGWRRRGRCTIPSSHSEARTVKTRKPATSDARRRS